jgi:nucleotide-binding universal stress UspA family protein
MDHHGAIVVGLGQTKEGRRELDWAAREARLRDRPLHVLRAYHLSEAAVPWETPDDRSMNAELRAASQDRLRAAAAYLADASPDIVVKTLAVDGRPASVLCDASAAAELTVVGSRQLGALGSTVIGSVGNAVAAAASGPVVVVRGVAEDQPGASRVVVGIDGSDVTGDVLDFAFEYASQHGCELLVVYCWPLELYHERAWAGPPAKPESADRWLAEAVAGRSADYPEIDVQRLAVRDHAIDRLVSESHSQQLLVVGVHAKHPRIATLLGSVTQGVLHHATCPVAVVHHI